MITFDDYQQEAHTTAIYPQEYKFTYPVLGLASEAGEVAGKVKKVFRDKNGDFNDCDKQEIGLELGGVLWYVAEVCSVLGLNMGDVAIWNLEQLASRKERGVLGGSGDQR